MKCNRLLGSSVLALVLASSLVACGGGGDDSSGTTAAQATSESQVDAKIDTSKVKKTLTVGVDNPYYLFHEDVFMADKLGYFKDVGIDSVKIITTEDPMPGLVGGSLDLMLYGVLLILAVFSVSLVQGMNWLERHVAPWRAQRD